MPIRELPNENTGVATPEIIPPSINWDKKPTIAPSRAAAMEQCPGYISEFQELRDEGGFAGEGTFLHLVMEEGKIPNPLTEEHIAMLDGAVALTEEQLLMLSYAFDFYGANIAPWPIIIKELKIEVPFSGRNGYVDVVTLNHAEYPTHAQIVDWKFGRMLQEHPSTNLQFQIYALALFIKYPTLKQANVISVYPRMQEFHTALFMKDQVRIVMERLAKMAVKCDDWQDRLAVGEHCKWCGRRSSCKATTRVTAELGTILDPSMEVAMPVTMEAANVVFLSDMAKRVAEKAEHLKKYVNERVKAGDPEFLEFFKLISKRGSTSISDLAGISLIAEEMREDYTAQGHNMPELLTLADLSEASKVSLAKIKKLLMKNAPTGLKSTVADRFEELAKEAGILRENKAVTYAQRNKETVKPILEN